MHTTRGLFKEVLRDVLSSMPTVERLPDTDKHEVVNWRKITIQAVPRHGAVVLVHRHKTNQIVRQKNLDFKWDNIHIPIVKFATHMDTQCVSAIDVADDFYRYHFHSSDDGDGTVYNLTITQLYIMQKQVIDRILRNLVVQCTQTFKEHQGGASCDRIVLHVTENEIQLSGSMNDRDRGTCYLNAPLNHASYLCLYVDNFSSEGATTTGNTFTKDNVYVDFIRNREEKTLIVRCGRKGECLL